MRAIRFRKSEKLSFHLIAIDPLRCASGDLDGSFIPLSVIFPRFIPHFSPLKIFQRSLADTVYKHAPTELRFNAPEMLRPYAISGYVDPPARFLRRVHPLIKRIHAHHSFFLSHMLRQRLYPEPFVARRVGSS